MGAAPDVEDYDGFSIDDPTQWEDIDKAVWARYIEGPQLEVNDKGLPLATNTNVLAALTEDMAWHNVLGFNERSGRMEFLKEPPCKTRGGPFPRPVTDSDMGAISIWLGKRHKLRVQSKSDHLHSAVLSASEDRVVEPVRDYLESLVHDGQVRLPSMLKDFFGCEDTPLTAESGLRWMISAVARAYQPGCQADYVLTFVGEQGRMKSTTAQTLAGKEFFADRLPDLRTKDASQYLQGVWVVEMGELDSLKRNEMSAVKAFITAKVDRYRDSYGRLTEDHPRRCVFMASTNEETCLRDSTGNRRFWPVRVVGPCDRDGIAEVRDQLWAEAVARYKAGEPWWFDEEMEALAREKQEEHSHDDAWGEKIDDWLHAPKQRLEDAFGVGDILKGALDIEPERWTKNDQMRVAAILQRLGWKRVRRRLGAGQRRWLYDRPASDVGPSSAMAGPTSWDNAARPSQPAQPFLDLGDALEHDVSQPFHHEGGAPGQRWSTATVENQAFVPTDPTGPTSTNRDNETDIHTAVNGGLRGFKETVVPTGQAGPGGHHGLDEPTHPTDAPPATPPPASETANDASPDDCDVEWEEGEIL